MSDADSTKKPLKHLEIALNKFKETAVPYHLNLLEERKSSIKQSRNDASKLHNHNISIKRIESQLKTLLYELDTLRAQVVDSDLDRFDDATVALRKTILQIINEYKELRNNISTTPQHKGTIVESTSDGPRQIQIYDDIQKLKLQEKETCLSSVECIQTDIQDLHSMYGTLNQIVGKQSDMIDQVEANVEETQANIDMGSKQIVKASRLKAAMYPATGAVIGGVIGGPVGLLAGTKVGSIVAIVCGGLGYIGGRLLNRHKNIQNVMQVTTDKNDYKDQQCYNENSENKKHE